MEGPRRVGPDFLAVSKMVRNGPPGPWDYFWGPSGVPGPFICWCRGPLYGGGAMQSYFRRLYVIKPVLERLSCQWHRAPAHEPRHAELSMGDRTKHMRFMLLQY